MRLSVRTKLGPCIAPSILFSKPTLKVYGAEVVSVKRSSFRIEPLIFFFKFKENVLFKSQKNGFNFLRQNMWLIQFNGAPAAMN
jgi:hypothetical protein